jgi:hypothetical protein
VRKKYFLTSEQSVMFSVKYFVTFYIFRIQFTKKREIAWGKLLEKFMLNALCGGIID